MIRKLKNKSKNSKLNANLIFILSEASGLFRVLKTFLSISLSQISFAMHPNPLTKIPPTIILKTV